MYNKSRFYFLFCLFCLLFLFSGCNILPGSSGNTNVTPNTTAPSQPKQNTPTPVPQASTSCPANATARAAIMPPLTSSTQHQTLVYVWNQQGANGASGTATLRRYDTASGNKSDIIALPNITISNAQVSADGQ